MQAAHRQQPQMLQVALRPTTIPGREVDHVRRDLFEASSKICQEPHLEPGATHERCFHEIVTENLATQWGLPWQFREVAVRGKLTQAQDRVMAPVVAFAELPEGQATGQHEAIQSSRELDEARE